MGKASRIPIGAPKKSVSILICLFVPMLLGMARTANKDHSRDPQYSLMINKEFRTKSDLVLYQTGDTKTVYLEEFGDPMPTRQNIGSSFPYKTSDYGDIILGILPESSVFKIIRIEEQGPSSATFIHYRAVVLSTLNKEFLGKEIDPTLLSKFQDPPQFDPSIIEEVPGNHER